jgi:hypothetical protein
MRTIIQTLFFFLLVAQICFAQWVNAGLDGYSIKDIAAKDSIIFAVTSEQSINYSGKVFRSVDNGTNWVMIVDSCARNIAISPTGKVFMVKDTALYYSLNNGDTWIYSDIMEQIDDSLPCNLGGYTPRQTQVGPTGIIFCFVAQRGPIFGNAGWEDYFAISTDGGLNWRTPANISRGGALFYFRNQFVITIGGSWWSGSVGGGISLSSDYGITWEEIGGPNSASALGIFTNGNIICGGEMVGEWGNGIFLSSDTCSTHTQISTMIPECGLTIPSVGLLVGTEDLGVFLFSDEGDSLGSRNEGFINSINIQSLALDNNGYIYAGLGQDMILSSGGVWRRPLSEIVTSIEEQTTQPTDFILSQNFPNPFNPSTKISWQLPVGSQQTLKIYDVLGNEIMTLIDEYKPAGRYEIEFNASTLPSGVYFYQLKAGSFVKTKKMLLLK